MVLWRFRRQSPAVRLPGQGPIRRRYSPLRGIKLCRRPSIPATGESPRSGIVVKVRIGAVRRAPALTGRSEPVPRRGRVAQAGDG